MRRRESVSGGLEWRTDGPAVSCNHRLSHLNAINVSEPVYLLIAVTEDIHNQTLLKAVYTDLNGCIYVTVLGF